MKKIGKVMVFDGRTGIIFALEEEKTVDFSARDFSEYSLKVGDVVEFREEKRADEVRLARNIKVIQKKKTH